MPPWVLMYGGSREDRNDKVDYLLSPISSDHELNFPVFEAYYFFSTLSLHSPNPLPIPIHIPVPIRLEIITGNSSLSPPSTSLQHILVPPVSFLTASCSSSSYSRTPRRSGQPKHIITDTEQKKPAALQIPISPAVHVGACRVVSRPVRRGSFWPLSRPDFCRVVIPRSFDILPQGVI